VGFRESESATTLLSFSFPGLNRILMIGCYHEFMETLMTIEPIETAAQMIPGGGMMWKRKGCPRCQGDLFVDEEVGSNYIKCLQCGYEKELAGGLLSGKKRAGRKGITGIVPLAESI
jgi:hypothetical protein